MVAPEPVSRGWISGGLGPPGRGRQDFAPLVRRRLAAVLTPAGGMNHAAPPTAAALAAGPA